MRGMPAWSLCWVIMDTTAALVLSEPAGTDYAMNLVWKTPSWYSCLKPARIRHHQRWSNTHPSSRRYRWVRDFSHCRMLLIPISNAIANSRKFKEIGCAGRVDCEFRSNQHVTCNQHIVTTQDRGRSSSRIKIKAGLGLSTASGRPAALEYCVAPAHRTCRKFAVPAHRYRATTQGKLFVRHGGWPRLQHAAHRQSDSGGHAHPRRAGRHRSAQSPTADRSS